MNLDLFTLKSKESLELGQKVALKLSHQQLDGEHLHYGAKETH